MSQEVIDLLKIVSKAHINNSQRIDDIEDQIIEIEEQLEKIVLFIEFHLSKEKMTDLGQKGWPPRIKMSDANLALSDENWNRFMPKSSEAFSTISVQQDLSQEHTFDESSPSSQE
jgi:hypothetical protein